MSHLVLDEFHLICQLFNLSLSVNNFIHVDVPVQELYGDEAVVKVDGYESVAVIAQAAAHGVAFLRYVGPLFELPDVADVKEGGVEVASILLYKYSIRT